MLHPGDDLLPDIAALAERDAVVLIEQHVVRKDVGGGKVGLGFRDAVADTVGGERSRIVRGEGGSVLAVEAPDPFRKAAVDEAGPVRLLPDRADRLVGEGKLDLGAQAIERQPLHESIAGLAGDIEAKAILGP